MNLSLMEPWNLINILHQDFDNIANAQQRSIATDAGYKATDWSPAVDIFEQDEQFVLKADLPGVKAEDIEINMEKNVLSISGERMKEASDDSQAVKRIERVSGKFQRRFSLPETANPEMIDAKSSNGILEIIIPKKPEVKARRIEVKSS